MKHFALILFVAAFCSAAPATRPDAAKSGAAAKAATAANPEGVPKGATEVSPGVYRFVDKEKNAWVYRKTPFGYMRSADKPEATPPPPARSGSDTATPFGESKAASNAPVTKVTDAGDSVKFERPSPFGVYRWTRKKTELTEDEKKLWEASSASRTASK